MGFDVFLQTFNASDSAGIRLDELAAIFGSALKKIGGRRLRSQVWPQRHLQLVRDGLTSRSATHHRHECRESDR
jgi:hypothetical protein